MLVRMSEEDPDYEGKWPEGDAMSERVLVPREPTVQSLLDMAITYDHSYGLLPNDARENVVRHMRQLYDAALRSAPAAPQQVEPVAQIGWADEFGNLFPMGAWKPAQRTHHDSHKTAWRPVFLHPPAAEVQRLRDAAQAVVDAYRNLGPVTVAIEELRRALGGGE